jgi:hypothetical protein
MEPKKEADWPINSRRKSLETLRGVTSSVKLPRGVRFPFRFDGSTGGAGGETSCETAGSGVRCVGVCGGGVGGWLFKREPPAKSASVRVFVF